MRLTARSLFVFLAVLVLGTAVGATTDTSLLVSPAAADASEAGVGVPRAKAAVISAGFSHTCAITGNGGAAGGDVRCWGSNNNGQLGLGDTNNRGDQLGELSPATAVSLGANAIGIAAGPSHTCTLLVGGSVKCWGQNQFGQLGNPAALSSKPSTVFGF